MKQGVSDFLSKKYLNRFGSIQSSSVATLPMSAHETTGRPNQGLLAVLTIRRIVLGPARWLAWRQREGDRGHDEQYFALRHSASVRAISPPCKITAAILCFLTAARNRGRWVEPSAWMNASDDVMAMLTDREILRLR